MKLQDTINIGVDVKRCSECEYKNNEMRDELLVTSGVRAAYMDDANCISIPGGLAGECNLARFISYMVDIYMNCKPDVIFDEYIEAALIQKYGGKNENS